MESELLTRDGAGSPAVFAVSRGACLNIGPRPGGAWLPLGGKFGIRVWGARVPTSEVVR